MKQIGFVLFLFVGFCVSAQIQTLPFLNSGMDAEPENFGGKQEFKRFITYHLIYPENALKKKIEGTVDIKYVIDGKGQIYYYTITNNPNPELAAEAIRLFKMLLFHPAIKREDTVAYEHHLSIPFSISKYKKSLKLRGKEDMNPSKLMRDTSFVIHQVADIQPKYLHGTDSLLKYIYSSLEYPEEAKIKNIEGIVVLSFIVEPTGFISNINVERSVGGGCQEEAIRVISETKWYPAQKDKKLVRYRMTYSIEFKLNNEFRDNSSGSQRVGGY